MKTVLVVDDEDAISETLAEVLDDEGYRCHVAANGREALNLMAETRPDLVICDVMMPVLDGREMLREMRRRPELAGVPVVMTSAASAAFTGENADHQAFLKKPFKLDTLLATVRRLLGEDAG